MLETKRILRETINTQTKLIHKKDETINKQIITIQDYKDVLNAERKENSKLKTILKSVLKESKSQQYGNVVNFQNKIKELVNDFDSNY